MIYVPQYSNTMVYRVSPIKLSTNAESRCIGPDAKSLRFSIGFDLRYHIVQFKRLG